MSAAASEFLYLDDDRAVQGPYAASELLEWRAAGYFTDDTLITPVAGQDADKADKEAFKPFRSFFPTTAPASAASEPTPVSTSAAQPEPVAAVTPALTSDSPEAVAVAPVIAEAKSTPPAAEAASSTSTAARAVPPPPPPRPTPPPAAAPIATPAPVDAPAAAAVPPPSASEWFYLDDQGAERGPFPASDMAAWFAAGFFTGTTRVRTAGEKECAEFSSRAPDAESFVAPAPAAALNAEDQFEVDMSDDEEDEEDDEAGSDSGGEKIKEATEGGDTEMKEAPKPAVAPEKLPWFYTDKDGVIRGPFAPATMLKWHRLGFFAFNDSALRRQDETEAVPLSKRTEAPSFYTAIPPPPPPPAVAPGATRWYYRDAASVEHGPFTEVQMRGWWDGAFLKATLLVRQVGEADDAFSPISTRDCAFTRPAPPQSLLPAPHQQQQAMRPPQPYPQFGGYAPQGYGGYPPQQPMQHHPAGPYGQQQMPAYPGYSTAAPYGGYPPPANNGPRPDYAQSATLNTRGRGVVSSGYAVDGLAPPTDRDLRQMNHYMHTDALDAWQQQQTQRHAQGQHGIRGGGRGGGPGRR